VLLFEKAIAVSQQQEARLFELRATARLASVLAAQGRAQEAETRLRVIIDKINTKHQAVDLASARSILNALQ
jgi:hypothetical protein